MKKFIATLFSAIVVPIVPSLVAGYMSDSFKAWCFTTLTIRNYMFIILAAVILVVGVLGFYFHSFCDKQKRKKEEQEASNYKELENKFKKIVDDIDYLQSIQFYEYRLWSYGREEKINVNYLCGYSDTNISINAIQQDCYSIPIELFSRYNEDSQKYNKWLNLQGSQARSMYHQYEESTKAFSSRLEKLLLESPQINELNCCLYRLLRAQQSNLNGSEIVEFLFDEEHKQYETELLLYKRTGLLPSIFFEDTRFFRNVSGRSKNGRVYMTFRCDRVKQAKRGIILLALDGTVTSTQSKSIQEIEKDVEEAFNAFL